VVPWGRGLLLLLAGLFLWVRICEAGSGIPRWGSSYLDDVLCLPLLLSLVSFAQRLLHRSRNRTLPRTQGLMVLILFSIYFEAVLPTVSTAAVGDPRDALAYALGLAIFEFGLNRSGDGNAAANRPARRSLLATRSTTY
jgi:hypothetical protein